MPQAHGVEEVAREVLVVSSKSVIIAARAASKSVNESPKRPHYQGRPGGRTQGHLQRPEAGLHLIGTAVETANDRRNSAVRVMSSQEAINGSL
jgi:hypothetical protein